MNEFNVKMSETLIINKKWLSKEVITRLKHVISLYDDCYQHFYEILIKEKMVREDAYKADRVVRKIEIPASEQVSEDIKSSEIALRLSMLSSQLSYLNRTFDLNVDACTISCLKNLLGIFQYINWENQLYNDEGFMNHTLGDLVRQMPATSPILAKIYELCHELYKLTNDALICLNPLILYAKENYKNLVTISYLQHMDLTNVNHSSDKEMEPHLQDLQRKIKAKKDMPFYHDLCLDAIRDNYSAGAVVRQNRIIEELLQEKDVRLSFEKKEVKLLKDKKLSAMDLKKILIEALIEAGKYSIVLDLISKKLSYNQRVYQVHRTTATQKCLFFLKNLFGKGSAYYTVAYPNMSNGLSVSEKVEFFSYLLKFKALVKKLHTYSNSELIDISALEKVEDDKLVNYLTKIVMDIKNFTIKGEALDKRFKDGMKPNLAKKFKGISNEFKNISYGARKIQDLIVSYSNEKMQVEMEGKLDDFISKDGGDF